MDGGVGQHRHPASAAHHEDDVGEVVDFHGGAERDALLARNLVEKGANEEIAAGQHQPLVLQQSQCKRGVVGQGMVLAHDGAERARLQVGFLMLGLEGECHVYGVLAQHAREPGGRRLVDADGHVGV